MSQRALSEQIQERDILSPPQQVRDYLKPKLFNQLKEVFVIFLDAQNRLVATKEVFAGTLTQTSVYSHEVVRRAL